MQQAGFSQFAQDHRQAAGIVEVFHQKLARWLKIKQTRHFRAQFPIGQFQIDPESPGQGDEVINSVRRSADGCVRPNGIFEGLPNQNFVDGEIFAHHLDNAPPGQMSENLAPGVNGRYCRVVGQPYPKRFDHRRHRRSRSHGHAVAPGPIHTRLRFEKFGHADLPRSHRVRHLPNPCAGADPLPAITSVQHRAAGDHQRRHVAARRAH